MQFQLHREAGYYIQTNKEVGLLYTADQGGRFCREQSSDHKHPGSGRYSGHFLQTPLTFTLRREENFDTPIDPFDMAVRMSNNAHSFRIYSFPNANVLEKGNGPTRPTGGREPRSCKKRK